MPLPSPNLDDRSFQDILDEARRLIPRYCPEWTDHNLSDPGITLLELFAWMTDLLLYRLNRVPEKNHIAFLELLGMRLEPARPAVADLTFRLSAPQPEDVRVPRGTAVSTLRTDTREAVSFATDRDLIIRVPRLDAMLACRGGTRFHDYRPALDNPQQGLGVFQDRPMPEDGLYLGFGNDLSGHTLAISVRCRVEGIGVDPNNPPLSWETWDGYEARWVPLRLELDTTGGLNRDGLVVVHLPYGAAPTPAGGQDALWVRARVLQPRQGQPGYSASPRLLGVSAESLGGLVPASHASRITGEELGLSDGTPGQRFQLSTPPVLPRRDGEYLEVEEERGHFEPWFEVPDFGRSGPRDLHYVLDESSGTIELGPRIRSPLGEETQYGRVPPAGRRLRFSSYRSGGGLAGNVGARTLTVLQASIPYIAWVTNFEPAVGGTEPEDLEHAKWRVPGVLRGRDRAVTPEDFEVLAREATPGIARARCVPVGQASNGATPAAAVALPGTVHLQLVPALPEASGPLQPGQLEVPARIRHEVQTYLDERRLLTSELVLEHPTYTWVSVIARVRPRRRVNRARLERDTTEALYRFVHPTTGGADGGGWEFGRELFAGEIYSLLQNVDGVDFVQEVTLHAVDPATRDFGPPSSHLAPAAGGLLASYEHRVRVE